MSSFGDTSGIQPSLPSLAAFPVSQGGGFVQGLLRLGETCPRWWFGRHRPGTWRMPRLGPEAAKDAYLLPPKYGHPEDVLDAGTWSDIVTIDPIR